MPVLQESELHRRRRQGDGDRRRLRAPASRRWWRCCSASTMSTRARSRSTARTFPRSPSTRCAARSPMSRRRPICSRAPSATTSATAGLSATDAEIERAASAGRGRRVHPPAAAGLRHAGRRRRLDAVGRPAPARLDRPRHRAQCADPAARRGDLGARQRGRGPRPGSADPCHGRAHHHRHRASAVDGGQCRPHHRAGRGPAGRGRHACLADGRSAQRLCPLPPRAGQEGAGACRRRASRSKLRSGAARAQEGGREKQHERSRRYGPGGGGRGRPHGPDADPRHPYRCRARASSARSSAPDRPISARMPANSPASASST